MKFIEEVEDYIIANSSEVKAETIFLMEQPADTINCLVLIDTGGFPPDNFLPVMDPTIQCISRASDYETAKTKAELVRNILHRKQNITLSGGSVVLLIEAMGEPGDIGRDLNGNFEISCNYRFKVLE
ncbi:MAG: minor capsid protein [Proteobacteria bacterium]|jgi:hypothetical protein|nr:minor capsid protein [Pseudomonadota bacterium]